MVKQPDIVTTKTAQERLISLINDNKSSFLLTEKAEEMLEHMRLTRNLFITYTSRSKVVSKLIEEHNFASRTAWRLVEITPQLFSIVYRDYSREFHVDIHLQKIEETRALAIEANDFKTAAACDANRAAAIREFMGSAQMLKPQDLELPPIEFAFRPELFNDIPPVDSPEFATIISNFKKRKVIKDKIEARDVDYEEIKE